jgi:hypothetical protein
MNEVEYVCALDGDGGEWERPQAVRCTCSKLQFHQLIFAGTQNFNEGVAT